MHGETWTQQPRGYVRSTAGGKADDEVNRLFGIIRLCVFRLVLCERNIRGCPCDDESESRNHDASHEAACIVHNVPCMTRLTKNLNAKRPIPVMSSEIMTLGNSFF